MSKMLLCFGRNELGRYEGKDSNGAGREAVGSKELERLRFGGLRSKDRSEIMGCSHSKTAWGYKPLSSTYCFTLGIT